MSLWEQERRKLDQAQARERRMDRIMWLVFAAVLIILVLLAASRLAAETNL